MEIIRRSSLDEYATEFWNREQLKNGNMGGANPLAKLLKCHDYKLPFKNINADVVLVNLDRTDIAGLIIHGSMAPDDWMRQNLTSVPEPFPRRLDDLAALFLQDGFFDRNSRQGGGTQARLFWQSSKAGRPVHIDRTMIQQNVDGSLEIVDGFGRLLAYEALLQRGYDFRVIDSFLASVPPPTVE